MTAERPGWRLRCNGDDCRNTIETEETTATKARVISASQGWGSGRFRLGGESRPRLVDYCPVCRAADRDMEAEEADSRMSHAAITRLRTILDSEPERTMTDAEAQAAIRAVIESAVACAQPPDVLRKDEAPPPTERP